MCVVSRRNRILLLFRQCNLHGTRLRIHRQGNRRGGEIRVRNLGKGNIEDYLGINIKEQGNGNIKLTQPQIIDILINDVQLPKKTAP